MPPQDDTTTTPPVGDVQQPVADPMGQPTAPAMPAADDQPMGMPTAPVEPVEETPAPVMGSEEPAVTTDAPEAPADPNQPAM